MKKNNSAPSKGFKANPLSNFHVGNSPAAPASFVQNQSVADRAAQKAMSAKPKGGWR